MKSILVSAVCVTVALGFSCVTAKSADEKKISKENAQSVALKKVPGGKVLNWSLEEEKGQRTYAFDIEDKSGRVMEVEVSADTGKVTEVNIEIEEEANGVSHKTKNAADLAELKKAKVTKDDAKKRALAAFAGEVQDSETEIEEGKLCYEFLIKGKDGTRKTVAIDATSGSVIEASIYLDGSGI